MKTRLILGAAALALAACGSGDKAGESGGNGSAAATGGGGDASAGATARSGGAALGVSLQPGEWEIKTEVVNVKVEGLPEGVADGMKAQAGGSNRTCMTPEEAKGPSADVFAKNNPANCKSEGFSWSGGRIQGKTTCTGDGGAGKTVMTMDGRYSPQSIDMTMKSETDMMGKAMTMEMRVSGKRVGECTAATKEG
ncbi:MAG TPA: DUF3617 domain-containing protein [Allosphingosinicella sp.]|jgi:hypothetical protein